MAEARTPTEGFNPRSMLFVSGESAERFPKAIHAGADAVCIDLEDAVRPERKEDARGQVLKWLAARGPSPAGSIPAIGLRLNGVRTVAGLRDVVALIDSAVHVDFVLLPKVEDASDVQCLQAWVGARFGCVIALVETPLGVERAAVIARAGGKLAALMLGGADLSAELGAQFGWDGLLHARGRIVNAAKAAGLQAWDVPHIDIADAEGLVSETRRALALGFDCKTAIHPKQVARIHEAFAPSAEDAAWAGLLLQAVPDGRDRGAFLFQGRMVDGPLLRKARRIDQRSKLSRNQK